MLSKSLLSAAWALRHACRARLVPVTIFVFAVPSLSTVHAPIIDSTFDGAGAHELVFAVKKWGRFSIEVESTEGAGIQFMDRKVGVRSSNGVPGETDGRVDEFLDVGEYKVVLRTHPEVREDATLRVWPFRELNRSTPQYLVPLREYHGTLRDHQQVSYWIHLPQDTTIHVEAIGRNVADIQLWRNGQWRVDSKRASIEAGGSVEQPLRGYRLVQNLPAGYYQLTVYGGREAEWARSSEEHPFYLRWGAPRLGATGMGTFTISEKGFNQYLAPASLRAVVLEVPEKKRTVLTTLTHSTSSPHWSVGRVDSIHGKSADPRCMVRSRRHRGSWKVIQVAGKPGQTFTLQTLGPVPSTLRFKRTGTYWVSTLHTGFPADQLGVSGGIVRRVGNDELIATVFDTISASQYLYRRFNLLSPMTLFVWLAAPGKYEFELAETPGAIEVQRMVSSRSAVRHQELDRGTGTLTFDAGAHVIRIRPERKGIATLFIRKASMVNMVKNMVGMRGSTDTGAANIQFPAVRLAGKTNYGFFVNSLSPELCGAIVRPHPLDLNEPLPVYLEARETVRIPIKVGERSWLTVETADGTPRSFTLDKRRGSGGMSVGAGSYTLVLSGGESPGYVFASTVPEHRLPDAPPDPFPTGEESPLPLFAELEPGNSSYLDLSWNDDTVFEFDVPEPGIYRLATTGRLKTGVVVRDRFTVRLLQGIANGVGRNGRILSYLLPGRYQAVVSTKGRSAGRCGVEVRRNPLIDGGTLTGLREKRHRVPRGEGIAYKIKIADNASYRLVSEGQAGPFAVRLDDADGWPVVPPGSRGEITTEFSPGVYRLVSLPQDIERLRVARLSRTAGQVSFRGKGPHRLELNRPAGSTWSEERDSSGSRLPAVFVFRMPARAPCQVVLTDGFTAVVRDVEKGDSVATWKGARRTTVGRGTYRIEVLADKEQNLASYQLSVRTEDLLAGLSHRLTNLSSPRNVTVRVGSQSVVELFSQGMADVAGALYDRSGRELAANDDDTRNWNFRISRVLSPGVYTLRVEPRASSQGLTTVTMTTLVDTVHKQWGGEGARPLELGGRIHVFPVTVDDKHNLISVTARKGSRTGCRLERMDSSGARVAESEGNTVRLAAPVTPGATYRVSVWSVDHLDESIELDIRQGQWKDLALGALRRGRRVRALSAGAESFAWVRVDLGDDSLGHFRVRTVPRPVWVSSSSQRDRGFELADRGVVSSLKRYLWIGCAFDGRERPRIHLDPVRLGEEYRTEVRGAARAFALPPAKGRVAVVKARMDPGRPACGIAGSSAPDALYPAGIAVRPGLCLDRRTALTVALESDPRTCVMWNSSENARAQTAFAGIECELFPYEEETAIGPGYANLPCDSASAHRLRLKGNDPLRVRVALPPGGVAVRTEPDGSRGVWAAGDGVVPCELYARGGEITIVNTGPAADIGIECLKAFDTSMPTGPLTIQKPSSERSYATSGVERIPLGPAANTLADMTLGYHGAVRRVDWWTPDGTLVADVQPGDTLCVPHPDGASNKGGGYLAVDHDPGLVKVDLCSGDPRDCRWGLESPPRRPRRLDGPATMRIADEVQWIELTVSDTQHVAVDVDRPCVATLLREGERSSSPVALEGLDADLPLLPGRWSMGIRAPGGGQALSGAKLNVSVKPTVLLREDSPPKLSLAPGDTRILRFVLTKKRRIGLGIRANREVVRATLLTPAFEVLAEGQQQFIELPEGLYFVRLSVPRGAGSTVCTVHLVGQKPPPDTPPESVIRRLTGEKTR